MTPISEINPWNQKDLLLNISLCYKSAFDKDGEEVGVPSSLGIYISETNIVCPSLIVHKSI